MSMNSANAAPLCQPVDSNSLRRASLRRALRGLPLTFTILCGALAWLSACSDEVIVLQATPPDGEVNNGDPGDGADAGGGADADNGGAPTAVPVSDCYIPPAPDLSPLRVTRAFQNMVFSQPVYLTSARDGSDRIFVLEKRGVIHVFENNPNVTQSSVFLDLRDRIFSRSGNDERGLLGLTFDPNFASNGYFWVNYTANAPGSPTTISRFRVSQADPNVADPASEVVAMTFTQPYGNHNGGMIDFGPDGHLYISSGDGGSSGDPENNSQNLGTLYGTILRIDVRNLGGGGEYSVPPNNPFINTPGARPEIYAYGLRNVWRFAFDRLTGQLWAADVGQRRIEEVNIIEAGGNYGWRKKEGMECYNPSADCEQPDFIEPVTQYDHSVGASITGGFVYRGARLPELGGAYLYGDFRNGQVFALATSADAGEVENPQGHESAEGFQVIELAQTNLNISSFGEDESGEIYIVDYTSGGLYQLDRAAPVGDVEPLPQTLTETGCFDDVANQVLDAGLIPYTVNAQLWSDGAAKTRYFTIPEGTKVTYDEPGAWDFPLGSIIVKNFYLDRVVGDPGTRQIIETRFMVRDEDGWDGYSYQWNDEQTEAFLLPGAVTKDFALTEGGQPRTLTWEYPSRAQCRACHTEASGQVLGLRTGQLNRAEPDGDSNQLDRYVSMGLFANPPTAAADALPRYPKPFSDEGTLAQRARAYMHSNCAPCHLPNGTSTSDIDLRYETPLMATRACLVDPQEGDLGVPGLKILTPGNAEASSLYLRTTRRDDDGMPPMASTVVHDPGAGLIRDWINSLSGCNQ